MAHAYHLELVPEVDVLVRNLACPFDLHVTTPDPEAARQAFGSAGGARAVRVHAHPNRGRDMAPFVALLCGGALDAYDVVLKLHLKKSGYSAAGGAWRRELFGALCGDAGTAARSLACFDDPAVGMVGPHASYLTRAEFWGSNRARVAALLRAAGALAPGAEPRLGFFAGSMFWFRPEALRDLRLLPADLLRFEDEAGQRDGTTAHALERILPDLARHAGFVVTSLAAGGTDVAAVDSSSHRPPVL